MESVRLKVWIYLCVQCSNNSTELSTTAYLFIKSHLAMADSIQPAGRQPLYYTKEFAFTKMKVDKVSGYSVLYLYSAGVLTCFCFRGVWLCTSFVVSKYSHLLCNCCGFSFALFLFIIYVSISCDCWTFIAFTYQTLFCIHLLFIATSLGASPCAHLCGIPCML